MKVDPYLILWMTWLDIWCCSRLEKRNHAETPGEPSTRFVVAADNVSTIFVEKSVEQLWWCVASNGHLHGPYDDDDQRAIRSTIEWSRAGDARSFGSVTCRVRETDIRRFRRAFGFSSIGRMYSLVLGRWDFEWSNAGIVLVMVTTKITQWLYYVLCGPRQDTTRQYTVPPSDVSTWRQSHKAYTQEIDRWHA